LPPDTLLNVNVPDLLEPTGFAITRQGKRRYGDAIVEKDDPRGRKYYWIGGTELDFEDEPGTDFAAVNDGLVSVTPLHLDLTNYEAMRTLASLRLDWP
jgi:5'-nucleotidase